MSKKKNIFFIIFSIYFFFIPILAFSQTLNKIEIKGNERIPNETILMFSNVEVGEIIDDNKLNLILKNLYESNFFKDVFVKINDGLLEIELIEYPIIENISFNGIKAKKIVELITKNLELKSRSSFNSLILLNDRKKILSSLKEEGYYFAKVETIIEDKEDNKIDLTYDINLGDKAKIKKISFIGNKIFKDRKLISIILSEEFKFWKIISGKKYLNEDLIKYDERLLTNYYLNKGYYNVKINSSFAKIRNNNEFELIFNIDANDIIYFNNLSINLPDDFLIENYKKINFLFEDLKDEPYSINSVEEILNKIDEITLNDEFKSITASVEQEIVSNKINLNFIITEAEKFIVKKINIFGNSVTRENVIRNQLEIDEGDPYNEILQKKTENNLRNLNFFKTVNTEVIEGKDLNDKIINITVEEKATGEISAGAGFGTSGSTFNFGIRENNYLGKGLTVDADVTVSLDSFRGKLGINNPNYKNSDKSVFANIQSIEIDRTKNYGYKTNKTGFEVGTNFEYLDDLNLGFSGRSFFEKISTDSSASATQQKQKGNYFDAFANLSLSYDKRNQKFKTTSGFISSFGIDLPLVSENNTLTNAYNYKYYTELYENNISSISLFLKSANSITGDDIKLSERISIPGSKLRGFEIGKIGPKDGVDYIGGNHAATLNFTSTLPQILENAQNVDFLFFVDAANLWGVDYDTSIGDGSKIRSSVGLAVDWFTPIGPLNFSISETLSKSKNDVTESFRFNLGTTF
jgi:outer membrane protein insertion porin family